MSPDLQQTNAFTLIGFSAPAYDDPAGGSQKLGLVRRGDLFRAVQKVVQLVQAFGNLLFLMFMEHRRLLPQYLLVVHVINRVHNATSFLSFTAYYT